MVSVLGAVSNTGARSMFMPRAFIRDPTVASCWVTSAVDHSSAIWRGHGSAPTRFVRRAISPPSSSVDMKGRIRASWISDSI